MSTEDAGQNALRKAIAEYYRTKLPKRYGPFEALISSYGTTQYKGWVREATALQASLYKKVNQYAKLPGGKSRFYEDLARVIGTDEEYASEIDYFMIKDILEEGGVRMISSKDSPDSSFKDKLPVVYVKRLSYDHYNYWRLIKRPPVPGVAPKPVEKPAPPPDPKSLSPTPPRPAPVPPKPAPKRPSPPKSGESTNNSNEERQREELFAQLERRMDRHTRCVEKCKALGRKVEEAKKELSKLGK
jgi:hypothetical protein